MSKVCLECGKIDEHLKEGFCPSCLKKLSKNIGNIGKPKGWNPQKDILWKPSKGNGICIMCWNEIPKSEMKLDNELGFEICGQCKEKKEKIRKRANLYWKGKEPSIRSLKE